ncbi:hypothetical protein ACP70R_021309 [Stipagrostis hirtigluma subsp. patula]
MAPAWERARRALAAGLCIRVPGRRVATDDEPRAPFVPEEEEEEQGQERDKSPAPASTRRLSRSGSRSSPKLCAICLGSMRSGHGQALFTAECSHKFHFNCISSNVQHGNHVCPICRALWKELPFQGPLLAEAAVHGTARVNPSDWPQGRLPRADTVNRQDQSPIFHTPESAIFNDDEQINLQSEARVEGGRDGDEFPAFLGIMTYTEFPAIQEHVSKENFAILIHLKAPHSPVSVSSRAPLDLVTVLDVSGSMAGTKLALLKRAMSFVIQTLGPSDRLSVIAFSSSAWRLFPLRKMTAFGRQQSLQAVSSLVANGGTNIADGLRKAARVMEDRQARNPVCSIILLSDGVDTYTVTAPHGARPDYGPLVPRSILPGSGHHVPVHAFGFGADHDSAAMHSVAEMSGGTFSFIDAVGSIQDAFAQCIGGLLSVVAQETRLSIDCADDGVLLTSVKSGGYASGVAGDGRGGYVDVGDLYADEERDFLVTVRVPPAARGGSTALVVASCTYRDAVTGEAVRVEGGDVAVRRPASPVSAAMSPQVEREWLRVHATEDMAAARAAAEGGEFARAASILESRRRALESRAALSSDPQTLALVAELREMQDRAESRQRYEESGRAYILAGLSSHSWQRATARGDSTELSGLVHTYQTPSMVDMLHRSQALLPEVVEALNRSPTVAPSRSPGGPASLLRSARQVRPTKSFPGRPS